MSKDFRWPNNEEGKWIANKYQAVEISYEWPHIFIQTSNPPSPVPLTVAGVAAKFLPVGVEPRPLIGNNLYFNSTMSDLIPNLSLIPWELPSTDSMSIIAEALSRVANILAINYMWPTIYVELRWDGRQYESQSLPGIIGGCATVYHHGITPFWDTMKDHARTRAIDPSQASPGGTYHKDETNYVASGGLCSGALLQSKPVHMATGPFSEIFKNTTAGVMVKGPQGEVRVTAANHGFLEDDEVFHPSSAQGIRIGKVVERWEAKDVALIELESYIPFKKEQFFSSPTPAKLLRKADLKAGAWFVADGATTGPVKMQVVGLRLRVPPRPEGIEIDYMSYKYLVNIVLSTFGPMGGHAKDGICGAALVHENPQIKGVGEFFQLGNDFYCFAPCLDEFMDGGWSLC